MALNPSTVNQIKSVFDKKNWPIDVRSDIKGSLFQRFCERMEMYDKEEIDVILILSRKFIYIQFNELTERIFSSLYSVNEELYKSNDKIIIAPLKINDKNNSAVMIWQILSRINYHWMDYSDKFILLDDRDNIKRQCTGRYKICLLDDFIGTGETVKRVVDEFVLTLEIPIENIFALSFIAQESGRKYLEENNIKSFSDVVIKKGISDLDGYSYDQKQSLLSKMKIMESKIDERLPDCSFSLGYKQSEALVSILDKSPNNTFPLFWFETNKKISIFPRFDKYIKQ